MYIRSFLLKFKFATDLHVLHIKRSVSVCCVYVHSKPSLCECVGLTGRVQIQWGNVVFRTKGGFLCPALL